LSIKVLISIPFSVLLPQISNHARADLFRAGVRRFGYQAMIHAMTCTIDGQWSTIGAANEPELSPLVLRLYR
jgi:cardiolipin synthase